MEQVIIGLDPHKLSATIEVVDHHAKRLGAGSFTTDQVGYTTMRTYANCGRIWWAVQGANGVGRPLAQRLLEAGESVVDVPANLAARVRLFDTGQGSVQGCGFGPGREPVAVRDTTDRSASGTGEEGHQHRSGHGDARVRTTRDVAGRTLRRIGADELSELIAVVRRTETGTGSPARVTVG